MKQIPFLNILVMENFFTKLEFNNYREDNHPKKYILKYSHCKKQHKGNSSNFLVHQILSFPLNSGGFEKENSP